MFGCGQMPGQVPGLSSVKSMVKGGGVGVEEKSDLTPKEQSMLTPEEQRLRELGKDTNKSFIRDIFSAMDVTVLAEALVGAGVGAGISAAITRGDWDAVWKTAVGTGALTAIASAYMASRQKKAAGEEDIRIKTLDDVRRQVKSMEDYNDTADKVVNENKEKLKELNAQITEGLKMEEELKQKRKIIQSNRKQIAAAVASAKDRLKFFEQLREDTKKTDPANVEPLNKQIDRYNNLIVEANKLGNTLDGLA
jgi:hypothetical protein